MKRNIIYTLTGLIFFCFFNIQTMYARDYAIQDVNKEIAAFNSMIAKNKPADYKTKLTAMKIDPFSFLRATAHVMIKDIQNSPSLAFLNSAPGGLIHGDLHVHNFSVLYFRGKKGSYGVDDMDEAHAGKLSWDLFRLCTSLLIASDDPEDHGLKAAEKMLDSYNDGLEKRSNPDWPDVTFPKFLQNFIEKVVSKDPVEFLNKYTKGNPRKFMFSSEIKPLPANEAESFKKTLQSFLTKVANSGHIPASELELHDVVIREGKGLSSIGLSRYFALTKGQIPDGSSGRILEIKEMRPSCIGPSTLETQARDTIAGFTAAHRDRDIFLGTFVYSNKRFLVRELFPWAKRYEFINLEKKEFYKLAEALGAITADFHSAHSKPALMKDWLKKNRKTLLDSVEAYAKQIRLDWKTFCK
ncbi:MAG: DUF2252 family protein [Candidatus Riflebacteria bacterium]|nr:DUF2252 family protein [Candidatus Riflebacteria bacterium]